MLVRRFLVILLLCFLAFGCGESPPPQSVAKPAREVVRVGYTPIVASLPIFVAEQQKLFEQVGIRVELVSFSNSNDMVNAAVAGQVDVLPAVSLVPILHLESKYPNTFRLFSHSRMRTKEAFDGVVTKADSPVRALSDLQGRKVGVFPGTSAYNMFAAFLDKNGVSSEKVTLIALAPPLQLGALEAGSVDALFTYEPLTTIALKTAKFRALHGSVYADLLEPCPIGASVVVRRFERERPTVAANVLGAIDKAVTYIRKNPTEAKALLPSFAGVSPEIASAVNLVDVTLSNEVDAQNLQRFADLLKKVGELPQEVDVKPMVRVGG